MVDDHVLESTTDTQDQIEAALGSPQSPPDPEQQDAITPVRSAGAPGEPEQEPVEQEEVEETPAEPKLSRRNQRIRDLIEERNRYKAELEARSRSAPAPTTTQPAPPKPRERPLITEYDDLEEFRRDETAWIAEQVDNRVSAAIQRREVLARQAEAQAIEARRQREWEDRVADAESKLDDFDQVAFANRLPVTDAMFEALKRQDNGPEILYHLGKNPQQAAEIARMDPFLAAGEIRVLSRELAPASAPAEAEEISTPPTPTYTPTHAPTPPRSVRGASGGAPAKTMAAMEKADLDDYRKMRGL